MPFLHELQTKREAILDVTSRYRLRDVRVFGSVAEGKDTLSSDVDFLVNADDDASLFDLMEAQQALEAMLGRKVDIVTERGLYHYIRDKVLAQARAL